MTTIRENIERVEAEIADAAARAGRNRESITLVAVSKTHPAERVLEAVAAGLQHFGENRVEESESKIPAVQSHTDQPLTWHMIGHVQSRKAKDVAPLFDTVHSVDTIKLARKLSADVPEGKRLDVLLEMNVSGEVSKEGMNAALWHTDDALRAQLLRDVGDMLSLPRLNVCGLMTVAPIVEDPQDARPVFIALRGLRDMLAETLGHQLPHLSMGMTDDFAVAIQEGATMVRIGRAIFGERAR